MLLARGDLHELHRWTLSKPGLYRWLSGLRLGELSRRMLSEPGLCLLLGPLLRRLLCLLLRLLLRLLLGA